MTDTAQRLKSLRQRLRDLEWELGVPSLAYQSEATTAFYEDLEGAKLRRRLEREITRLSEYERLGYDEPNF